MRYRKGVVFVLLLCLLSATSYAGVPELTVVAGPAVAQKMSETPEAKINGPNKGPAGEMVIFTADGSKGKSYDWLVLPDTTAHRGEGGRSVSIGTNKVGVYYVVLIVTEGDQSAKAIHEYNNEAVAPGPNPPEPGPGPGPAPSDWLSELRAAATLSIEKMPDGIDRAYVAQHVAMALATTVREIRSGQYKTNGDIASATQRNLRRELGDDTADSLENWGKWLGDKIKQNVASGNITTPETFADAYDAIAKGLSAK
jgi:hypothetical protein